MEDNGDTGHRKDLETNRLLSQWEIDSLLGAAENAESQAGPSPSGAAGKKIRPYDFRRPDKFSKEHLRALQTIHESFARAGASSLASLLRMSVQVRLSSIEQAVYGEYVQQLENPTVMYVVRAEPLPGPMIIEVNFGLAFAFMDRLLGGFGQAQQRPREVTDIELLLLKTIINSLVMSLREAWLQLCPVTTELDDVCFNPENVQAALPGDVGVLVFYEVRFGDSSGTITMFLPHALLEPVIEKLSTQMWMTGAHKETHSAQDEIKWQLNKVEIPIVVRLGTTTVTMSELSGLQEGNVIRLGTAADQELEVLVGGTRKYWARPGRVGRNLGVMITRIVSENSLLEHQLNQLVEPLLVET